LLQAAVPWLGVGQASPQPPQFSGSLAVEEQLPPQVAVPEGQSVTHWPPAQTSSESQLTPQPPQCLGWLSSITHSSPQRANPLAQAKPQRPPWQVATAFAGTSQASPHAPQWATSESRLTQAAPQRS
jgi:hypothetical protein